MLALPLVHPFVSRQKLSFAMIEPLARLDISSCVRTQSYPKPSTSSFRCPFYAVSLRQVSNGSDHSHASDGVPEPLAKVEGPTSGQLENLVAVALCLLVKGRAKQGRVSHIVIEVRLKSAYEEDDCILSSRRTSIILIRIRDCITWHC